MSPEYKLLERVQLVNLPSTCQLHNKRGFIAGKSIEGSYIVWLDVPTDTHLAVSISEFCIEPEPVITGGSGAWI